MKRVAALALNRGSLKSTGLQIDYQKTAKYVAKVLKKLGWDVVEFEVSHNLNTSKESLKDIQPEVVFNLVDALMESGEMAPFMTMLFSSLRLAYTGVDSTVFSLVNDKLTTKWHLLQAGLPTPQGTDATALAKNRYPGPGTYIIKSRFDHTSKGLDESCIVSINNSSDLLIELKNIEQKIDSICIAEQYIDGPEYSVSILESSRGRAEVIGIAEVVFHQEDTRIVHYGSLWKSSRGRKISGADITLKKTESDIRKRIERLSHECWEELGLCGYARLVFRADKEGKIFMIDAVTNPSLAENAAFLHTARLNDWAPGDVVSFIIEGAIARHNTKL